MIRFLVLVKSKLKFLEEEFNLTIKLMSTERLNVAVLPIDCSTKQFSKLIEFVNDDPILSESEKFELISKFRRQYVSQVSRKAVDFVSKQGVKRSLSEAFADQFNK